MVYIFANSGAFLTTALYTTWLGLKERTFGEFRSLPDVPGAALPANYLLALLTGCLWYSQFLFYGLAHVRMGQLKFSSWAIHMTMLILISSLAGVAMREWSGCRTRTKLAIVAALAVLIAAVLMLTYGNYVAEHSLARAVSELKRFVWRTPWWQGLGIGDWGLDSTWTAWFQSLIPNP